MMVITKEIVQRGMVGVVIDDIVPCLKSSSTGELVPTEVIRIEKKVDLKKFNTRTGWNINWSLLPKEVEVYGLRVKGDTAIQGLVGIRNAKEANAVYIHWASTAPNNNKEKNNGQKDYIGVGAHLFAIASEKSLEYGYEGYIYGYASSRKILNHYIDQFGAVHIPIQDPYQFIINEEASKKIREVYDYEWNYS